MVKEISSKYRKYSNNINTKEKLDADKKEKKVPRQKVVARDIEHLKKLIKNPIKEDGNKCDLNYIDVSHIEDMSYLFSGSKFFGDISKWNVSSVTNMSHMFYNKINKNNVEDELVNGELSKWDVSNVTNMNLMFYKSKFNGDISQWDVSNVIFMQSMFDGSAFNGDLSKWYKVSPQK